MPKISVIVPIYNVELYIEKCAKSLFEQSLDDVQYIFIDDSSPDESVYRLKKTLELYPNRKGQTIIEAFTKNQGLPFARRRGVELASGDFILHCDSDDWLDNKALELLYNNAVSNNSDIVVFDIMYIYDDRRILRKCYISSSRNGFIKNVLYQKIPWSMVNKLIKRELYCNKIQYPIKSIGEDMVLFLQLLSYAESISYESNVKYYYRQNPNSLIHTQGFDMVIKKYNEMKISYLTVVENCDNLRSHEFASGLNYLRLIFNLSLKPLLYNAKARKLWNIEPLKISWRIIFDRNVALKWKLLYIYCQLRKLCRF